jgi:NAD(P)-dependent dehydrogenase (short-subunit alcohol dehydrogenase family)
MSNVTYYVSGRSVTVTGAARGRGRAIAAEFVKAGADVVLVVADSVVVEEAAAELSARGAVAGFTSTTEAESHLHYFENDMGAPTSWSTTWAFSGTRCCGSSLTTSGRGQDGLTPAAFKMTSDAAPSMAGAGNGWMINVTSCKYRRKV